MNISIYSEVKTDFKEEGLSSKQDIVDAINDDVEQCIKDCVENIIAPVTVNIITVKEIPE